MEEARLNRKVRNNFRKLEYKSYQKKRKKDSIKALIS